MTSLEELYRRHAQDVFRFAYWLSGGRPEAEDITSETFVRAWAGAEDLRMATVKAHLIAIARNLFLQRRRQAKRHEPLDMEVPDTPAGPERQLEREDELRMVLERLQALPEIERAALLMHAELVLPHDEIARALGLSLSALDCPAPLAREVEMRALERAKRLVNWRSVLIALGVFFAVFPVTYSANNRDWHWDLIESPLSAAISAVLAVVCWGAFFAIRRALRARRS